MRTSKPEERLEQLRGSLETTRRKTFEFWLLNIKIIAPPEAHVSEEEKHYTARLLTALSLNSTSESTLLFPTFTSLVKIHDEAIMCPDALKTPKLMENAGCQVLLLGGFYMQAARKHYDLHDIEELGKNLFAQGASGKRRKVIKEMSRDFGKWQHLLCYLEWYLRNNRLLIAKEPHEEPIIIIP